ncbi:MAG: galactokinase [Spirochaetes bacterium]|nr:galactokinase [Spirochaetota bacterium]
MKKEKVIAKFREVYGSKGDVSVYFSPGRVNLIGEHIDYNGGHVFPMAIDTGTYVAVRKRPDKKVNFCSYNFDMKKTIGLEKIEAQPDDNWIKYPKGVLVEMKNAKYKLAGMDVFVYGDLPNGAGLSSSASLEVACAYAFARTAGKKNPDLVALSLLAQRAENDFVGVKCGIMDQFASAMGKKSHAILLNTETMKYAHVPLTLTTHTIVIANSNKKRGLVDSEYNARRAECERALKAIQAKKKGVKSLCQLGAGDVGLLKKVLSGNELKRARFAVEENARVLDSMKALKRDDIKKFGELMNASHDGLRDMYEVSCKELDALVSFSREVPGVLGSRMTGAGFGGCIVSLVPKNSVEQYIEHIYTKYKALTRLDTDVYIVHPSDGVHELED